MEQLLAINATRETGKVVRDGNVTATSAVANILRTSFGPKGLDKMLVDDIGETVVTNDGATLLKLLEVEHPAAKVLVQLSGMQDEAVGDGTTSVVLVAAELLKRAMKLINEGVHPTLIIRGYRRAQLLASQYLRDHLTVDTSTLGRSALINVAKTTLSSKIIGSHSDFFSEMVVDAVQMVKRESPFFGTTYPIKAINIIKSHGQRARDSELFPGYAINRTKASLQMPSVINDVKIAFIDFPLQKARLKMGIQVLVTKSEELEAIRARELNILRERIELILNAGANVVLCSGGVEDMAMKYFVEAGAIAVRRVEIHDMRRLAKATGGEIIGNMADPEGGEVFHAESLGTCENCHVERVGDGEILVFDGLSQSRTATLLIRGPNEQMIEETHRSIHDALCAVRRTLTSGKVVAGGGAVETALHVYLRDIAEADASREQTVIGEFAEAMLIIPKTLASNAALDSIDLTAELCAVHSNPEPKESDKHIGLDLEGDCVRDNLEAGVLEPSACKESILDYATEACITVLRIEDVIRINPPPPQQQ